jgi:hypothetical protein
MMQFSEHFLNASKEWQLQNNGLDEMNMRLEFPSENIELFDRIERNS